MEAGQRGGAGRCRDRHRIDIGPTVVGAGWVKTPEQMDGRSFFHLAAGKMKPADWRQNLLYDELYDLETDPDEQHNLIFEKQHQPRITGMHADLHKILADSDAARVPFSHKKRVGSNLRLKSGSSPADFPPQLMREKNGGG